MQTLHHSSSHLYPLQATIGFIYWYNEKRQVKIHLKRVKCLPNVIILSISSKEWGHLSSSGKKMDESIWAEREKELVPLSWHNNFWHLVIPWDFSCLIIAEHWGNHKNYYEVTNTLWRKFRQISAVSWALWITVYTRLTNSVGSNPLMKSINVKCSQWFY